MGGQPRYQKNMLLPVSTVEQIRALRGKYESDTAVVIAAIECLTNKNRVEVLA